MAPTEIYANSRLIVATGRKSLSDWLYRVLVCASEFAVTALSITGVYLWLRQRAAQAFAQARRLRPPMQ